MGESLTRAIGHLAESGILPEVFAHPFMIRAVLAALIAAPLFGAFSPIVVAKRLAFFSSTLGHAALSGVAVALLLGEPLDRPYVGIFGFTLLMALAITYVRRHSGLPADTIVGVFLAFGLGLGICLLVAVSRRFNIHQIEGVLFGSLVTVTELDLLLLGGIALIAVTILVAIYNDLVLGSLDPILAASRGVRVVWIEYLFMVTLTLVIAASIKIIGALLVEALVIVPAAAARNVASNMRGYFLWSCLFALLGAQGGLLAGALLPVPSGAAIVLALAAVFFLTLLVRLLRR
ncbi:MAG: metal ABC transporter permease [Deltaproteobacteria bacterium]|nr:MAG: metal ABC transporter permease [Deltaproteobacteria bacterium]